MLQEQLENGYSGGDVLVEDHVTRRNEPISDDKRSRGSGLLDMILRMPDFMDSGRR